LHGGTVQQPRDVRVEDQLQISPFRFRILAFASEVLVVEELVG
jgi:hypothetical protein